MQHLTPVTIAILLSPFLTATYQSDLIDFLIEATYSRGKTFQFGGKRIKRGSVIAVIVAIACGVVAELANMTQTDSFDLERFAIGVSVYFFSAWKVYQDNNPKQDVTQ